MDNRIIKFLSSRQVMSLATRYGDGTWSANLFYVFDFQRNRLIFTSSAESLHIVQGQRYAEVSCAIVGRSRVVSRLRGAQIVGVLRSTQNRDEEFKYCKQVFSKRFPLYSTKLKEMWYVEIRSVKYTDNRLGFGTKIIFSS